MSDIKWIGPTISFFVGLILASTAHLGTDLNDEDAVLQGRIEIITGKVVCFVSENNGQEIQWKCYPKEEIQNIINNISGGKNSVR